MRDIEVVENDTIDQLKGEYGIVRPICNTCFQSGYSVVTRMALKVDKNAKKEQRKARDFEDFSIVKKS